VLSVLTVVTQQLMVTYHIVMLASSAFQCRGVRNVHVLKDKGQQIACIVDVIFYCSFLRCKYMKECSWKL